MVSALGQNGRYNRYISAFLERLLRVTDELIEMAQYHSFCHQNNPPHLELITRQRLMNPML